MSPSLSNQYSPPQADKNPSRLHSPLQVIERALGTSRLIEALERVVAPRRSGAFGGRPGRPYPHLLLGGGGAAPRRPLLLLLPLGGQLRLLVLVMLLGVMGLGGGRRRWGSCGSWLRGHADEIVVYPPDGRGCGRRGGDSFVVGEIEEGCSSRVRRGRAGCRLSVQPVQQIPRAGVGRSGDRRWGRGRGREILEDVKAGFGGGWGGSLGGGRPLRRRRVRGGGGLCRRGVVGGGGGGGGGGGLAAMGREIIVVLLLLNVEARHLGDDGIPPNANSLTVFDTVHPHRQASLVAVPARDERAFEAEVVPSGERERVFDGT